MRLARLLISCAFAFVLSVSAFADLQPIGVISFSQPLGSEFDINNYTGPTAPPGFPVLTGLTLTGTLTIVGQCGSDCVFTNVTIGPDGTFSTPEVDLSLAFTSATFAGTLDPASNVVIDTEPNPAFLLNTFSVTLTDSANGMLVDGDTAVIYATTTSAPVPEPVSCLFLAAGLAAIGPIRFFRTK